MKKLLLPALSVVLIFFVIYMYLAHEPNGIYKVINIYKNKKMRVYVKGHGEPVILLSGWATENPIDDFMPLIDKFSLDFKVIVPEYFGYGKSDLVETARINKVVVQEIRTVLKKLNIEPPYILMPHSMSGLYCLYYANYYPNEIYAIIGLDMSLPQKQLERWTEKTFERTKLNTQSSELNSTIINQWNCFYINSKELIDIKYNFNLPVLAFLASEQINAVNKMIELGEMRSSWEKINQNMVTNTKLQSIEILHGRHYIHNSNSEKIYKLTRQFLNSINFMR